jgi:hypothetical protein
VIKSNHSINIVQNSITSQNVMLVNVCASHPDSIFVWSVRLNSMCYTIDRCNLRQVGKDILKKKTTENVLADDIICILNRTRCSNPSIGFVIGGQHCEWKISIDNIRHMHKIN